MSDVTTSLNRHYVIYDGVYLLGQENKISPIFVFNDKISAERLCVFLLKNEFLSLGLPKGTFSLCVESFSQNIPEFDYVRYDVFPVHDDTLPSRIYSVVSHNHLSRSLKRKVRFSEHFLRMFDLQATLDKSNEVAGRNLKRLSDIFV